MTIEVIGCIFFGGIVRNAKSWWPRATHVGYTFARPMEPSRLEQISKALAHHTGLRLLEAISAKEQINWGEIVSMRGGTPATVSHHLKILSEAGLIDCRRKGQFVYSQALPGTIKAYTNALTKIAVGKKSPRHR